MASQEEAEKIINDKINTLVPAAKQETKSINQVSPGEAPPLASPVNAPETTPLIERAFQAAAALEAQNKALNALLNRQEAALARMTLGGRSEAGLQPVQLTEQDIIKKEANDFLQKAGFKVKI